MNDNRNEDGIVLVLSIMLLGVVTAVGIAVSLLLVSETRNSIAVDESIVATYAAEAKVEEALDIVRARRLETGTELDSVVNDIQAIDPTLSITIFAGIPNREKTITSSIDLSNTNAGQSFLLTSLEKDQSIQFDVQPSTCITMPDDCVRAITISGERLDPAGTEPWIELTEVALSTAVNSVTSVNKDLVPESAMLNPANPYTYNFVGDPPGTVPTDVQTIRLTALYNGIKNLEIRVYTDANPLASCATTPCVSDLLGHININAIGNYGRAKIGVSASVPWRLPSNGLFDYVIFSEETVKQD